MINAEVILKEVIDSFLLIVDCQEER